MSQSVTLPRSQRREREKFVMEEDTRLASLEQPVMAYGAGTPSFSSYHGTQTETGNHGRMGKGPKHTRLVHRPQLEERAREQSIYFPEGGLRDPVGLFFQDSLRFMDLTFKL